MTAAILGLCGSPRPGDEAPGITAIGRPAGEPVTRREARMARIAVPVDRAT
jgi:hypothetical protein